MGGGDEEVLGVLGAEIDPRLLHLLRRQRFVPTEAVELAGEERGEAEPVFGGTGSWSLERRNIDGQTNPHEEPSKGL
jgi:hypothetical protein